MKQFKNKKQKTKLEDLTLFDIKIDNKTTVTKTM